MMQAEIMKTKRKFILPILLIIGVVAAMLGVLLTRDVAILDVAGPVAEQQRNILIFTSLLSLVVIVPVFVLTFYIVWKYREGNTKAKYHPDWDGNTKLEALWWGIPCLIILVLSVVTWKSSHDLDPYKPLASERAAVNVQVVALPWKWLFIYPDYDIASVNYLRVPEDTPVNFAITSDAPMNSFWIPELGGQVYAMSGMTTKLHLQADKQGSYNGVSANISGEGFAGMRFVAQATSQEDYETWIATMRQSDKTLSADSYKALAKPSTYDKPSYYVVDEPDLYDTIVNKYMGHGGHGE
jgi:cytochrome o ubiquinol oxidase subunit 2